MENKVSCYMCQGFPARETKCKNCGKEGGEMPKFQTSRFHPKHFRQFAEMFMTAEDMAAEIFTMRGELRDDSPDLELAVELSKSIRQVRNILLVLVGNSPL